MTVGQSNTMKRAHKLNSLCIVLILFVAFSCNRTSVDDTSNKNRCFLYKEEYRALYLRNCDLSELPDSIAFKDIRHLAINSIKLIDFGALSRRIDLRKIISIRIDDLNHPEANLDMTKFEGLRSIGVFGGDKVHTINLINVSDSLRALALNAPNLTFPKFDSAFLGLARLYYGGQSEVIPQWVESLNHLQYFSFDTEQISGIECDVCKMDNIVQFSIVDRDLEDKEVYLTKMTVYPAIQKIRNCKPGLRFWTVLPPY